VAAAAERRQRSKRRKKEERLLRTVALTGGGGEEAGTAVEGGRGINRLFRGVTGFVKAGTAAKGGTAGGGEEGEEGGGGGGEEGGNGDLKEKEGLNGCGKGRGTGGGKRKKEEGLRVPLVAYDDRRALRKQLGRVRGRGDTLRAGNAAPHPVWSRRGGNGLVNGQGNEEEGEGTGEGEGEGEGKRKGEKEGEGVVRRGDGWSSRCRSCGRSLASCNLNRDGPLTRCAAQRNAPGTVEGGKQPINTL
jgi:hypothetical protein